MNWRKGLFGLSTVAAALTTPFTWYQNPDAYGIMDFSPLVNSAASCLKKKKKKKKISATENETPLETTRNLKNGLLGLGTVVAAITTPFTWYRGPDAYGIIDFTSLLKQYLSRKISKTNISIPTMILRKTPFEKILIDEFKLKFEETIEIVIKNPCGTIRIPNQEDDQFARPFNNNQNKTSAPVLYRIWQLLPEFLTDMIAKGIYKRLPKISLTIVGGQIEVIGGTTCSNIFLGSLLFKMIPSREKLFIQFALSNLSTELDDSAIKNRNVKVHVDRFFIGLEHFPADLSTSAKLNIGTITCKHMKGTHFSLSGKDANATLLDASLEIKKVSIIKWLLKPKEKSALIVNDGWGPKPWSRRYPHLKSILESKFHSRDDSTRTEDAFPNVTVAIQSDRVNIVGTTTFLKLAVDIADSFLQSNLKAAAPPSTGFTIRNSLPIGIDIRSPTSDFIKLFTGKRHNFTENISSLNNNIVLSLGYMDQSWTGSLNLQVDTDDKFKELQECKFTSASNGNTIHLGLHVIETLAHIEIDIFSPVCVINHTGLDLVYNQIEHDEKKSQFKHPQCKSQPALLNFGLIAFQLAIKTNATTMTWVDVPLLAPGRVDCYHDGRFYSIGVDIEFHETISLSTKVVLTPYYVMTNKAPYDIQVQEQCKLIGNNKWINLKSKKPISFWPSSKDAELVFKIPGMDGTSVPLLFNESEDTKVVLKINNGPGITVDRRTTATSCIICCDQVYTDDIPFVVINKSTKVVTIRETGGDQIKLPSNECLNFTFTNPANSALILLCGHRLIEENLIKNPQGSVPVDFAGMPSISWTTISIANQKFVIISNSQELTEKVRSRNAEPVNLKMGVKIKDLRVNLVGDEEDLLNLSLTQDNSTSPAVEFSLTSGSHFREMDLSIQTIQLDCQMENVIYETILAKNVDPDKSEFDDQPHASFRLSESFNEKHRYVRANTILCPTEICCELQVVVTLMNKFQHFSKPKKSAFHEFVDFLHYADNLTQKCEGTLIGELMLEVPSLLISFSASRIDSQHTALSNPLIEILGQIVEFNNMRLTFDPFIMNETPFSSQKVATRACSYLKSQLLQNLPSVALSSSYVGELIISIGRGGDALFCHNPIKSGKAHLHQRMGARLRNLYKYWVGGIAAFPANMADRIGKGLDTITGDDTSKIRRMKVQKFSKDPAKKLADSMNALIVGVSEGFSSVVAEPLKGSQKGFVGTMNGLFVGTIMFFTKPLSGLLTFISGFFSTVKDLVNSSTHVQRKDPPRQNIKQSE